MCGLQNRVSFAKPICFHFLNREKLVNIGKSPQNLKKVNQKPVFLFSGDGTALEMQEISFRIERISRRRKLQDLCILHKNQKVGLGTIENGLAASDFPPEGPKKERHSGHTPPGVNLDFFSKTRPTQRSQESWRPMTDKKVGVASVHQ